MPHDDGYDDRPKKSWRDIDKARDGKRSAPSGSPPGERAKLEKSASYSRYKSAADQFFSGNLVPDALAERIDPTGEGKLKDDALRRLKEADDSKQFAQFSQEYVDKFGLPDDRYLLDRLLGHPNESIVIKTLERLTEQMKAGELKPPKALAERLKSLELGSDNPDVQDAAKALGKLVKNAPR